MMIYRFFLGLATVGIIMGGCNVSPGHHYQSSSFYETAPFADPIYGPQPASESLYDHNYYRRDTPEEHGVKMD